MVDPHEARRGDDTTPASEADNVPEIIDGEVVDATRDDHASTSPEATLSAQDAATFRQFQQFQEFQKFQEWQRQHGGTPAADTSARPWWKRALLLLRYKAVRRLLYFLVIVVLGYMVIVHYFGGSSHHETAESTVPGNKNPGVSPVQGANPADPIKAIYQTIAQRDTTLTCAEFTPQAADQFAAAIGAPDCPAAVLQLNRQISVDPTTYANNAVMAFEFNPDAVTVNGAQAEVPACRILVQGGPHLGTFHLQQLPNRGWRIDGYQSPPANCPPS